VVWEVGLQEVSFIPLDENHSLPLVKIIRKDSEFVAGIGMNHYFRKLGIKVFQNWCQGNKREGLSR